MRGRTLLITGASGGIGEEVARQAATAGATVLVSARDPRRARATAGRIAGAGDVRALTVGLDLSHAGSIAAAAGALAEDPGRLDVLINNAAAYVDWAETATTADMDAVERVMRTNLFGSWRVTQALLPLLRESPHPRVVNVSSGAGSHGDPVFGLTRRGGAAATYGISKAALNALTATLAAELSGTSVMVTSVCPGLTATFAGAEAMGARPVADGAASVLWAAQLPDDGPRGGFFRDGAPLAW